MGVASALFQTKKVAACIDSMGSLYMGLEHISGLKRGKRRFFMLLPILEAYVLVQILAGPDLNLNERELILCLMEFESRP